MVSSPLTLNLKINSKLLVGTERNHKTMGFINTCILLPNFQLLNPKNINK